MGNHNCANRLTPLIETVIGSDDWYDLRSPTTGRLLRPQKVKRHAGAEVIVYSHNERLGYHGAMLVGFDGREWCVKDEVFDQSGEESKTELLRSLLER